MSIIFRRRYNNYFFFIINIYSRFIIKFLLRYNSCCVWRKIYIIIIYFINYHQTRCWIDNVFNNIFISSSAISSAAFKSSYLKANKLSIKFSFSSLVCFLITSEANGVGGIKSTAISGIISFLMISSTFSCIYFIGSNSK